MNPISFKESNRTLTKPDTMTDDECSSLEIYSDGQQCISCWKMSFKERLQAVLFGKIWIGVVSGLTQPPIWLLTGRSAFVKAGDNEETL